MLKLIFILNPNINYVTGFVKRGLMYMHNYKYLEILV